LLAIIFFPLIAINYKVSSENENENENNIIIRICQSSLQKEMRDAGKKPPPGMADYTCNCFYNKVYLGASLSSAQEICKQNASEKYKLESLQKL
tara:strand:- start:7698 stop:7979 length:282 start_codon:yes stop_codon:yes gene_type:complete